MENNYLYCIIGTDKARNFGPLGIGGRGDMVTTINYDSIAAVISSVPVTKFDLTRENLMSHQKVIEEVMKDYTVLPIRFCTIAESVEDIRRVLRKRYPEFKELLRDMDNMVELGVKALWKDLKGVFYEIGEKEPDIKRLKEKISSLPPEKSYGDKIALGRMVQATLESRKNDEAGKILRSLKPLCRRTSINKLHGDSMLLNAAFLVDRGRVKEFDEKMEEFGVMNDERLISKYVGPVPPFNFVNIVVEWK